MNDKQKKLRREFINLLLKDDDKGVVRYTDDVGGFKKFLEDKGEKYFNFKNGGLVKGSPRQAKKGW